MKHRPGSEGERMEMAGVSFAETEYKGTPDAGDIEWLRDLVHGDSTDCILSHGRAHRFLNGFERFIALADELESTANDTGAKGAERVALEYAAKRIREILEET